MSEHPPYRDLEPDFHYDERPGRCKHCGRALDGRDAAGWAVQLCAVCTPQLASLSRQVALLMGEAA